MEYVSTDVDRIIDYVKDRKRAELVEVARALNIKAMDVDKWAKILEKQGMIEIEYTLTKMYLIWRTSGSVEETTMVYEVQKPVSSGHEKPKHTQKNISSSQSKKPSDLFIKQILIPKTKSINNESSRPLREKEAKEGDDKSLIKRILPLSKIQSEEARSSKPLREKEAYMVKPEKPSVSEQNVDLTKANRLSMLLKNKVDAINQTVAEITELKSEKEKLYETEYLPLVSRLDNQISALSEKLAEREAAILALKRKMVELPNTIASIEIEMQDSSKSLSKVMDEYSKQIESISNMQNEISKLRESIRTELAFSRNAVKSCVDSVSAVEQSISSVNSIKEQAFKHIEEARVRIEEEQKIIDKMAALIDGADIQVSELSENIRNIENAIKESEGKIEQLEKYESALAESDNTLNALKTAYAMKKEELVKIAQMQETELNKLKMDIEKGFVRNYINELRKLNEEHEREATAVLKHDEELDIKLKTARERLQQLLKESKELNKKFEESI